MIITIIIIIIITKVPCNGNTVAHPQPAETDVDLLQGRHLFHHHKTGAKHHKKGAKHHKTGAKHHKTGAKHHKTGEKRHKTGAKHFNTGAKQNRESISQKESKHLKMTKHTKGAILQSETHVITIRDTGQHLLETFLFRLPSIEEKPLFINITFIHHQTIWSTGVGRVTQREKTVKWSRCQSSVSLRLICTRFHGTHWWLSSLSYHIIILSYQQSNHITKSPCHHFVITLSKVGAVAIEGRPSTPHSLNSFNSSTDTNVQSYSRSPAMTMTFNRRALPSPHLRINTASEFWVVSDTCETF